MSGQMFRCNAGYLWIVVYVQPYSVHVYCLSPSFTGERAQEWWGFNPCAAKLLPQQVNP